MNCAKTVSFGIIAGIGGFTAGGLVNKVLLVEQGSWLYWVIIVACVGVAIFLVGILADLLVIILTALIGAISIVNGIMLFTGGYE